jgi:Tfp pilus assembly ATPase PilU
MKCILLNCRYHARKLHVVTFQENVILVQVHRCVYSNRDVGIYCNSKSYFH